MPAALGARHGSLAIGAVATAVSWPGAASSAAVDVNGSVERPLVGREHPRAKRPQGHGGAGRASATARCANGHRVGSCRPHRTATPIVPGANGSRAAQAAANTQMIVRTASISLSTEKFDDMRAALERVAADRHGFGRRRSHWRATRRISAA